MDKERNTLWSSRLHVGDTVYMGDVNIRVTAVSGKTVSLVCSVPVSIKVVKVREEQGNGGDARPNKETL